MACPCHGQAGAETPVSTRKRAHVTTHMAGRCTGRGQAVAQTPVGTRKHTMQYRSDGAVRLMPLLALAPPAPTSLHEVATPLGRRQRGGQQKLTPWRQWGCVALSPSSCWVRRQWRRVQSASSVGASGQAGAGVCCRGPLTWRRLWRPPWPGVHAAAARPVRSASTQQGLRWQGSTNFLGRDGGPAADGEESAHMHVGTARRLSQPGCTQAAVCPYGRASACLCAP